MGSHSNYYKVILALLRMKDELRRVKTVRLQPMIKLLEAKKILLVDGIEKVPSNKDIANELGIKVQRSNTILRQLFEELFWECIEEPLEITNVIHKVRIMMHWEQTKKLREKPDAYMEKTFAIELQMKEIPRLGEHIKFEVVPEGYFESGVVHQITHVIKGKTQYIEIHVHPFENAYYRWARLKRVYDFHEKLVSDKGHGYPL